jgi:hypothetical protein
MNGAATFWLISYQNQVSFRLISCWTRLIVAVLWAWYKAGKPPFTITKVLVVKQKGSTCFHFSIENKKPYPIEILFIDVYEKFTYQVQKIEHIGVRLVTLPGNRLLNHTVKSRLKEMGHMHITGQSIDVSVPKHLNKLIFQVHTSHGFFVIKSKNIRLSDITKGITGYMTSDIATTDSRFKALAIYIVSKVNPFKR